MIYFQYQRYIPDFRKYAAWVFILFMESVVTGQVIPSPKQTDTLIVDHQSVGKANPGDTIRYKVLIENTGMDTAKNVQLNAIPDPLTSFISGSFRTTPLAYDDEYTSAGNVGISVPAGSGILVNDFDDNPGGLTAMEVMNAATTAGGSISISSDGSFTYTPLAGFTGMDTYIYTLIDGNPVGVPVPNTDMGTIKITVENMIWFVDNTGGGSGGTGTLSNPFKTLGDFNASAGPLAGHLVFIRHTGTNYDGGIVLENNMTVFGSGHTGGDNLADVLPFSLAPNSMTLPAIDGIRPVITNSGGDGVTLASDNTLRGFDVGDCSDFGIENSGTNSVGNLVVNEVSINNTTGGGFDASHGSGASMNAVFTSISSTGGVNGINLTNCAGTFTVNGGTITNPTGTGVLVSGGSVTVSCAANVTDNTGFAVDIDNHDNNNVTFSGNITSTGTGIRVQNCNGGAKEFSGSSKNLNSGANTAVTLSSNTGATIHFTGGGLAITTTSGTGFNATGGGTVTVQGEVNTINSTSATALNVVNTAIGANNLTFQSISSGNNTAAADPVNGIVLNNTATSGGLAVTGTGAAGSGGTIQNCLGNGIDLNNTRNFSLSFMNVTGNDGSGIFGDDVTGFSLTGCSVTNNTDIADGTEAGLRFYKLLGTCSMTNTTISGSVADNIRHTPSSGILTNFTISGCTISSSSGGSGYTFVSSGTAVATITFSGSANNFTSNFAAGFLSTVGGTSLSATFTNCTFTGNNVGVELGNGPTSDVTFSVSGCTFLNQIGSAMHLFSDANATTAANYFATISNNTIGNGTANSGSMNAFGIAGDMRGDVQARISLTNNTIRNTDIEGIFVLSHLDNIGSMGTQTLSLTMRGNTVFTPDDNSAFPFGFVYGVRIESRNATELCLDISSNTSAGVGGAEHFRVRQRDASVFRLERFIGDGTNAATVANFIAGQNDAGSTASATVATTYTGVADGFCPNP